VNHKIENGESIYLCDGPDPFSGLVAQFAVTKRHFVEFKERETYTPIAQLMNIVWPGLILTEHIFQGLKRPLLYGEDEKGDEQKLVFTWKAQYDWDWEFNRRFEDGAVGMTRRTPPDGLVFAVSATPNLKPLYPSVNFWIDRWYWIDEGKKGYPVDHETRYQKVLK
jgi:hypothetical protein